MEIGVGLWWVTQLPGPTAAAERHLGSWVLTQTNHTLHAGNHQTVRAAPAALTWGCWPGRCWPAAHPPAETWTG